MATEISYQTYDVNTDTVGLGTFTVDHEVDLGQADRLAQAHADEHAGTDVTADLTRVVLSDGRDLVEIWEDTYADEL